MGKKAGFVLTMLLFASILVWGPALVVGQDLTRATVAVEVQKHFESPKAPFAFSEEIQGGSDLSPAVNAFFKDNFLYVDWLSRESKDYRESLLDSVCAFLEVQGRKISDRRPQPKKAVSLHELKTIAVRNVFPLRVNPEGKIGTLICASAAGFADYPDRQYELEAFAFQTVFNDVKKPESFILARVDDYGKLARSLKLSSNTDILLKRAQGVYWALFYQNPDFEKLLIEAYREKAAILPFEIAEK